MIAFWVLAPIMVLAALGILFVRKAVHAALLLAVVMISLAVLYAVLEAPFLFAVQIIVYTGAILMLFLFVLMLVGVDASDSVVETIRGQRVLAIARRPAARRACSSSALGQITLGTHRRASRRPTAAATSRALANILFSRYVFAFEVTSALLITAAVGAMVLAHRERLTPEAQPGRAGPAAGARLRRAGHAPRAAAAPGVFARHNAVDTPALLPDGTAAESSVSRVLAARGTVRSAPALADDIEEIAAPARRGPDGDAGADRQAGRARAPRRRGGRSSDRVRRPLRDPVHDRLRRGARPGATRSWCSCASS